MLFLQHKVHVTLLPGVENDDLEFTMIYRYIRFRDSSEEFTGHAHWHHQFLSIPLLTSVPLTKTVDFIFKEENVSSLGQRTNFGSG